MQTIGNKIQHIYDSESDEDSDEDSEKIENYAEVPKDGDNNKFAITTNIVKLTDIELQGLLGDITIYCDEYEHYGNNNECYSLLSQTVKYLNGGGKIPSHITEIIEKYVKYYGIDPKKKNL